MGVRASVEIRSIWAAQGKACAICGDRMRPVTIDHPTRGWTIEHVFCRSSRRYEAEGNKLVSHAACNSRKADREPTGCEIILLHAVNAQLGFELTSRGIGYRDGVSGPSALAIALQGALAA
jgi:hypothetical protein